LETISSGEFSGALRPSRSWLALAALALGIGCGGDPPRAASPSSGLSPYSPEAASIFGDVLSADVFGLPVDVAPAQDPKLARRVAAADAIVVARVSTVSEQTFAGTSGYTLTFVVERPPLRGVLEDPSLEIRVGPTSPSLAAVRARGERLIGREVLLFVKRFDDFGEPVVHWYGAANAPALRKSVGVAKPLDAEARAAQTR
jgi:hypothetical protein